MDRCVVLVDAGYMMGAAATLLEGGGIRSAVTADWAPMLKSIVELAEEQTGMPVLRVLWYDAWYDGRPAPEHLVLGSLPDVKVRLGVLVRHGQRMEQKGVDSFLQRDMTTLARNNAIADLVLISGDEDIRRGVDEVQDHGVKVHLWGVEAGAPQFNQARSLITEADRRFVLSEDWVRRYIKIKPRYVGPPPPIATTGEKTAAASPADAVGAPSPAGATTDEAAGTGTSTGEAPPVPDQESTTTALPAPRSTPEPATTPAAGTDSVPAAADTSAPTKVAPRPGPKPTPKPGPSAPMPPTSPTPSTAPTVPTVPTVPAQVSPANLAPATATPATAGTRPANGAPASPGPRPPAPRLPGITVMTLAELSTERQKWRDNEEDSTSMLALPFDVGRRYGARWASRATPAQLARVRSAKPELPEPLERELMKFARDRGMDAFDDDEVREAVVAGAWRAVEDIARLG